MAIDTVIDVMRNKLRYRNLCRFAPMRFIYPCLTIFDLRFRKVVRLYDAKVYMDGEQLTIEGCSWARDQFIRRGSWLDL